MEKEFLDYTEALELKELGFDEPCLASWNFYTNELNYNSQPSIFSSKDVIQLPTFSQAFRFFRNVHKLWAYQIPWSGNMYAMTIYRLIEDSETVKTIQDRVIMNTWKEAELECLIKLIEIVKQK